MCCCSTGCMACPTETVKVALTVLMAIISMMEDAHQYALLTAPLARADTRVIHAIKDTHGALIRVYTLLLHLHKLLRQRQ
jgi:hypothetical protein